MRCTAEEVGATELRQNLQAFLARVRHGEKLKITSRGRVIAEISPPAGAQDDAEGARRRLRGNVLRYDDPTGPAFEPGEWEINR